METDPMAKKMPGWLKRETGGVVPRPSEDAAKRQADDLARIRQLMGRDYGVADGTAISRGHLSQSDAAKLPPPPLMWPPKQRKRGGKVKRKK